MTATTTKNLMPLVERLAEAMRTHDRLVTQTGGDPDKNPLIVRDGGGYIVIRRTVRPDSLTIISKVNGQVVRLIGRTPKMLGTLKQQVRIWERRVNDARAKGGVEWTERQRLNALAAKQVEAGWIRITYSLLVYLTQNGLPIRWRKSTTADAKKEQRELKQLLSQIG